MFIKVGLRGLSALQVAAARLDFGALTLMSLLVLLRVPLPREIKVWGHIAVVSLTLCVMPFVLYPWAEQTIDSGLASIYNAATPLMTTLVTLLALRAERPNRTQLLGLALGFLGVCVVLAPWQLIGRGGPVLAQFACLAATLSYGIGFVYMRKYVTPLRLPALTVAAIQVGLGAVLMTAVVALVDPHRIVATPHGGAQHVGARDAGNGFGLCLEHPHHQWLGCHRGVVGHVSDPGNRCVVGGVAVG